MTRAVERPYARDPLRNPANASVNAPPRVHDEQPQVVPPTKARLLGLLGPGLIAGASDDDPSGIATYSQAGAQLGFSISWTMLLTYPLMTAVQEISARIGRTSGLGIAGNIRRHYPMWLAQTLVGLLFVANTINIGADLGAMGAVVTLLAGGPSLLYAIAFGVLCAVLQILLQYTRYVSVLKWLALLLLSYFATLASIKLPWAEVARGLLLPTLTADPKFWATLVAILGTTISPYLFFWQSSQEAEDIKAVPEREPLVNKPLQAPNAHERIRIDTYIGMAFSNLVAIAIITTTAATLHASGVTNIDTASQAAEALKPLAGTFAFVLFALGIIATGLLSVPVLAGSAAYALGETFKWRTGLRHRPRRARSFYATIAVATMLGASINVSSLSPIKALYWSAVINGVVAVPVLVVMMLMSANPLVMGRFTITGALRLIGWTATLVMAAAAVGLALTAAV
jgi:NRAMP (natural resistance-associated macrophage protein)-like metal ion transporter